MTFGPSYKHIYQDTVEMNLVEGWVRFFVHHDVTADGKTGPSVGNAVTVKFSATTPPINPNASYGNVIVAKAKEYIESLNVH